MSLTTVVPAFLWRHVDDLSFQELETGMGREYAGRYHAIVFLARKAMGLERRIEDSAHGQNIARGGDKSPCRPPTPVY